MGKIDEITSIKHAAIVQARRLRSGAGRRELNKCLLEGEEIITWAMAAGWNIDVVFIEETSLRHDFTQRLIERNLTCFGVSEGIMKKVSQTNYLIPFIGVAGMPVNGDDPDDFVIVLDDVRDHGNLGTILRTASAFGIRDIFSTSAEIDFFYRKVIDASRGTVFNIRPRVYSTPSQAISVLRERGYTIITTSPHAKRSQSMIKLPAPKIALVVGNETRGASPEMLDLADYVVHIPMTHAVESLNVGVAAGISLYEIKLKQVILMLKANIQKSLGREVNVTGKLIQKAFDERLRRDTSYTSDQVIFLMILKCDQEMTRPQICKDLALFDQDLEEMITPLLRDGLVQENEDHMFSLSIPGEQYLAQTWGWIETIEEDIFADFTKEERDRFITYLQRLQERCIKIIGKRSEIKL